MTLMGQPPQQATPNASTSLTSRATRSGSASAKLPLLVVSLLVMGYAFVMVSISDTVSSNWELNVSLVALIWMSAYFSLSYLAFRTIYLFASTYVVTLVLFHLGVTIPDTFGAFGDSDWSRGDSARWLELSGWCTVLALGSLGSGFALGLKPGAPDDWRTSPAPEVRTATLRRLYSDGLGLLIASVILLALAYASLGNLIKYSRVDFFRGVGDTRGLGVFLMTFPSALIALVIGADTPGRRRFATIIAAFGVTLLLLSGYRSSAMFPLLIGVTLWAKTGRRILWPVAIGTLALVFFVNSAVGLLRNVRSYKEIDSATLVKSAQQSTLRASVAELGQTGAVLAEVIRYVPATDSYRYGQSYWRALELSIPNILPQMSKDLRAEGKAEAARDPDSINQMIPSDWITYRIKPDKFDVGEGVGFTGIGEPYINFGYPGVALFFAGLGYFMARMDSAQLLYRPRLLIFSATMFWSLVSTVRQDIGNFFKPALFTFLILVAWRLAEKQFPSLSTNRSSS
jgi:oligosaccharide repeat unit polymerase